MGMEVNSEILYKAMVLRARIEEIPAVLKWHLPDTMQFRPTAQSAVQHADHQICGDAAGVGFPVPADHVLFGAGVDGAGAVRLVRALDADRHHFRSTG